ncbi:hypothetical protein AGDE_16177 [Angomonas deanei]|nr:hypothetical protein AGDE_16177 [Angomonas deanei]|eukprot:EPY17600.1 hypothetical protein AGDE_16177 [Angomonas deanei]
MGSANNFGSMNSMNNNSMYGMGSMNGMNGNNSMYGMGANNSMYGMNPGLLSFIHESLYSMALSRMAFSTMGVPGGSFYGMGQGSFARMPSYGSNQFGSMSRNDSMNDMKSNGSQKSSTTKNTAKTATDNKSKTTTSTITKKPDAKSTTTTTTAASKPAASTETTKKPAEDKKSTTTTKDDKSRSTKPEEKKKTTPKTTEKKATTPATGKSFNDKKSSKDDDAKSTASKPADAQSTASRGADAVSTVTTGTDAKSAASKPADAASKTTAATASGSKKTLDGKRNVTKQFDDNIHTIVINNSKSSKVTAKDNTVQYEGKSFKVTETQTDNSPFDLSKSEYLTHLTERVHCGHVSSVISLCGDNNKANVELTEKIAVEMISNIIKRAECAVKESKEKFVATVSGVTFPSSNGPAAR